MLVSCLTYSLSLTVDAKCSSETSVDFQWTTRRYIRVTECSILYVWIFVLVSRGSRDSRVVTEISCRRYGRGSILSGDRRCYFSPQRPDRLWSPPSRLSSAHRLGRGASQSSQSSARSSMVELYLHSPYVLMEWCFLN
jgi:hypothetical protein